MKSLQQLLETEGSINTTGAAVANFSTPISFSSRRWAGKDEHVIPEDHYLKIRNGRERMARWDTHLPDSSIKAAVQKSLYRDGCCLVTNAKTNLSVLLKHDIRKRQAKQLDDDAVVMAAESTIEDEGDFTIFDEAQVQALMILEGEEYEFDEEDDAEYIQAFGYYSEDLEKDEDQSDVFAQIVACFFDNLYSSTDATDTIDSMFNAAVSEIKAGSESLGLNDVTIDIIHDAKKYIEENYDVVTGLPTDDGEEVEFDVEVDGDEDDVELTEAATLAELPQVNPEDPSKSETEGWAIVNIKANKVIDKPKVGETMEHKAAWLSEYHGAKEVQGGAEVAWVNTKTGVVFKPKADGAKPAKKK